MATNPKAYVDTSAFIAFLDRSDSHHSLFSRLFSKPPSLITTPLVIAEGQGWFLRRYDSQRALQFLNFIEDLSVLSIQKADEEMIAGCTKVLRSFSDQKLTLVDASGLYLMGKEKIKKCWSTDRHLSLSGAELVIHSNG